MYMRACADKKSGPELQIDEKHKREERRSFSKSFFFFGKKKTQKSKTENGGFWSTVRSMLFDLLSPKAAPVGKDENF